MFILKLSNRWMGERECCCSIFFPIKLFFLFQFLMACVSKKKLFSFKEILVNFEVKLFKDYLGWNNEKLFFRRQITEKRLLETSFQSNWFLMLGKIYYYGNAFCIANISIIVSYEYFMYSKACCDWKEEFRCFKNYQIFHGKFLNWKFIYQSVNWKYKLLKAHCDWH